MPEPDPEPDRDQDPELGLRSTRDILAALRGALIARHYSKRTRKVYLRWARRFFRFHLGRNPIELGAPEIRRFLEHLSKERRVSASTRNQAASAVLFLYRDVMGLISRWAGRFPERSGSGEPPPS